MYEPPDRSAPLPDPLPGYQTILVRQGQPEAYPPVRESPSLATNVSNWAQTEVLPHLDELRRRLLLCVLVTLLTATGGFYVAEPCLKAFLSLAPRGLLFVQLTPGEAFMATLKVSLILGGVTALPLWLFHAARFIFPGLHSHERQWVSWILVFGLLLFIVGAAFALWLIAPVTVSWLLQFGQNLAANQVSLASYLDFVTMVVVLTGLSFELPLVVLLMVAVGLVERRQLKAQWRRITVGLFVAAAILTPSQDPLSMVLVGLAMVILFGLSLWLTRFIPVRKKADTR